MESPLFRNAISRSRLARRSKEKSVVSKTIGSGMKLVLVPRFFVLPITLTGPWGTPRT